MKKIIGLVVVAAVLAIGGIVSIVGTGASSKSIQRIGEKEARTIAFNHSNIGNTAVEGYKIEIETKNNREYYDIDFFANGREYSYDIDAQTGAIIKAEIPGLGDQNTTNQSASGDSAKPQLQQETQPAQQTESKSETQPAQQPAPTQQPEPQPVQQPAPVQQPEPQPVQQSAPVQETPQQTAPSLVISEDQAKQAVLARVPGATNSNFWEFHLDMDDGRYEYEGELHYNGMEYSFEIDAYSGSFRDWEEEPIDD